MSWLSLQSIHFFPSLTPLPEAPTDPRLNPGSLELPGLKFLFQANSLEFLAQSLPRSSLWAQPNPPGPRQGGSQVIGLGDQHSQLLDAVVDVEPPPPFD